MTLCGCGMRSEIIRWAESHLPLSRPTHSIHNPHSTQQRVVCCRPRTHVGIYRGGWSQEVSPQPAGELAMVSRGAHGSMAAWQHVTRKFPVGGGRGRGEHQQLAAVAGPILQPAGEIRSPAAPPRRHQSTSQQSQHNYGEMNLIS